jgi:predicted HAD superfamily Cof-like phosphohydrolase
MPVYEKVKPKRLARFFPIPAKRKVDPVTKKLVVDENWETQTIRNSQPKGVGKKRRKRPAKQQKQIAA